MMMRRKRIRRKSFDGEVELDTDLPKAKDLGSFLSLSFSFLFSISLQLIDTYITMPKTLLWLK